MKVKLIFPPFWIPTQPYLSLPSLTAYLLEKGIDVQQIDLNLEVYDKILSADFINLVKKYYVEKNKINIDDKEVYATLELGNFLMKNIDNYKKVFRSEKALDLRIYQKCEIIFSSCLEFYSYVFNKEKIKFGGYESSFNYNDSDSILECIRKTLDDNNESFLKLILKDFIDELSAEVDLMGISVTGIDQIIPSFVLAAMIKRNNPDIKILIGGSIPSRWFDIIQQKHKLFQYIDYIIFNEGEYPLYALTQYLDNQIDITKVPNLAYKDCNDIINVNKLTNHYIDINELPTPVFNKSYIGKYFMQIVTLPLLSCRGCYWGKCTFCDHSFVYQNRYSKRQVDRIIKDIKEYKDKYEVKCINFHDEAISPNDIKKISQNIISNNIDIIWSCDARLDINLDLETLEVAYESGLKVIFFGLESINKRIISLMNKGTNVEHIKQILIDCKKTGLWSHLFFICGFPTESIDEFKETIEFIIQNRDIINSHGCAEFSLSKFSPVALNPDLYKINICDEQRDLALSYKFKNKNNELCDLEERKNMYKYITTSIITLFDEESKIIFRDHWSIFKYMIEEKKKLQLNMINKIILKSNIFTEEIECGIKIWDLQNGKCVDFSDDVKKILSIVDESRNNEEIIYKISREFSLNIDSSEQAFSEFCSLFKEYDFISEVK